MKFKKFISKPSVSITAFALAIGMLMISTVGGAQSALRYTSEYMNAQLEMKDIGVALVENGKTVEKGELLTTLLGEDKAVKLGWNYKEELTVQNTADIDQYVRVTVYKYWLDEQGNKVKTVSPTFIELDGMSDSWIVDESATTDERIVMYYKNIVKSGETVADPFNTTLTINKDVLYMVTQEEVEQDGPNVVYTTFDYDKLTFMLDVDVDAVQDHNAEAATLSAWGATVTFDGDTITGVNQ